VLPNFQVAIGVNGKVQRVVRDNSTLELYSRAAPSLNDIAACRWFVAHDGFPASSLVHVTMTRSTFGNLEAVIVTPGGELQHWVRVPNGAWVGPQSIWPPGPRSNVPTTLGGAANGTPSLIQRGLRIDALLPNSNSSRRGTTATYITSLDRTADRTNSYGNSTKSPWVGINASNSARLDAISGSAIVTPGAPLAFFTTYRRLPSATSNVEPRTRPSCMHPKPAEQRRIRVNNDWRRGRDSNPRYGFPYTHFPGVRLQPLGHPSLSRIKARRAAHIIVMRRGASPGLLRQAWTERRRLG
jgi:hypothetical protein